MFEDKVLMQLEGMEKLERLLVEMINLCNEHENEKIIAREEKQIQMEGKALRDN